MIAVPFQSYSVMRMMKRLSTLFLLCVVLLPAQVGARTPVQTEQHASRAEIRFGILNYRPKQQIERQWAPLIAYLNRSVPRTRFTLHPLTFKEMEDAVKQRKVDIVLTNPAFYVYLAYRYGLSSPMATRIDFDRNMPIRHFGGAIVVKSERKDLKVLADIEGRRIVTTSVHAFGGYLAILYQLQQAGLAMPHPDKLIETGMPYDKAIETLLSDKADVAFVRTGVIERMLEEGRLEQGQLRIINQQDFPMVPFAASTRLYPEWPVAALSHIDDHQANRIAAALLGLPHQGAVTRKMRIEGFNIPMDYHPVMEVMMALRKPPFDAAPVFTGQDILKKYYSQLTFVALLTGVAVLLFVMLLIYNRRLRFLRRRTEEGDNRLRKISARVPGMIYQYHLRTDGSSHYPYASDAARRLFGLTPELLNENAQHLFALIHPDDIEEFHARIRRSAETMQEWHGEFRITLPDGSMQWRLSSASPERQADGSILWYGYSTDITERKLIEERTQLLSAALEASANAIAITDITGKIEWVNSAFCEMTGYEREEIVGHNPRILQSGMHDAGFYREMWRTLLSGNSWRGEIINRRKDGSLSEEELIIAPVKNEKGKIHRFIGVKQDISARKRMEEELRKQATTDSLTGLPNRRYFLNLAETELSRIKRAKAGPATIIMLDIDHFKHVNDTYGHNIGDQVLRHLAETISGTLRRSDYSGRLGGEEFVVLLPETSVEQGLQFAERLRQIIASSCVATGDGEIQYAASFGVTIATDADISITSVINRADEALYRAKAKGRNRVEVG